MRLLRRLSAAALPFVSTLVILGVMGTLAVWGHFSHWTLPKSSALFGEDTSASASVDEVPARRVTRAGEDFPAIAFASAAVVKQNGIRLGAASARDLNEYVTANATVGYNQRRVAQVATRVPGHVWSLRVQQGQVVQKGDVLAVIDSQEVGQAKADYLQETFTAQFRARRLERMSGLSEAISERALREAEANLREARVRQFNAEQRLLNLGLHLDHDLAKTDTPEALARRLQFLGLPPNVVAEWTPRPATANLIALHAPFAGVVTEVEIVAGEVVSPDTYQLALADVRTMWVNLAVRQEDAGRLTLGQAVEFRAEAMPLAVTGTLTWVGTSIDPKTRTVQARCEVANPLRQPEAKPGQPNDGLRVLRANLFGTARVLIARHGGAVVVPDTAVQRLPDGSPVVFVGGADGTTFQARRVRLGLRRDGLTQVDGRVVPGDRVVTQGSFVLKSELMAESLSGG